MGWRVFGEGRRRNAAGGMRGGGQLEVSHSWVSCSVGGGEGREGLIFTSYFYTRGEFSLCWVGGGAAFLSKDFHFHWHCVTEQRFHT